MSNFEQIDYRLRRLERRNRLLGALLALTLGTCATVSCTGVMADKPAQTLTATQLQIVDAAGNTMIDIGPQEDGFGIVVRDASGGTRLALHHAEAETGLFLKDTAGDARVGIAHFAHGGSGVALHGPGVRGAAVLYYKQRGTLSFYDTEGNVTERFPQTP